MQSAVITILAGRCLLTILTVTVAMTMATPSLIYKTMNGCITKQIVLNPLPVVYVYDHCPFCVRVRMALGLKGIKHEVRFLANDDVETPTRLVNKKLTPIFDAPGRIPAMTESMDIIRLVDADLMFGQVSFFKPISNRSDIVAWQAKVAPMNRIIQRPRYLLTSLPEFAQFSSKNAFVTNHPLEPFTVLEWKAMSDEQRWQKYDDAYQASFSLMDECTRSLKELDKMIFSTEHCTEGGISLDDVDLWSRLRSVTLVKGVVWPEKLRAYVDNLSRLSDVPLYDSLSL